MARSTIQSPEFSRPVAADGVGMQGQRWEVSAEPAERAALARRFGLISIDRLSASIELRRKAGDAIALSGHLIADVVQSCVITLAPLQAHFEADFATSYSSAGSEEAHVDLDPVADDGPEPLIGGEIDLGEAVAQELAVTLDPYPRAPGAVLPPGKFAALGDRNERKRPFSGLAALKKRR